jgi:hypothetical protein
MGTELIPAAVILSPVVLSAAASRWVPEEWLQVFVEMARSLGRPM